MSTVNPYAPPRTRVDDVSGATSEAEAVRREHIKHEASVRSIGTLYYIGGAFSILGAVALLIVGFGARDEPSMPMGFLTVFFVLYAALGVLAIFVARGIRQLRSWARTAATVLSIIGLLGIPVGTIINGYFLYLLHSAKGKRIFAPDYAAIVAATPFVKYRTSIVVWIVLGLLVLVLVGAAIVGSIGR